MRLFLPDRAIATGRAVVCCPGGGYSMVATDHEGYAWAPLFNSLGIAFAVVDYNLPRRRPHHTHERCRKSIWHTD